MLMEFSQMKPIPKKSAQGAQFIINSHGTDEEGFLGSFLHIDIFLLDIRAYVNSFTVEAFKPLASSSLTRTHTHGVCQLINLVELNDESRAPVTTRKCDYVSAGVVTRRWRMALADAASAAADVLADLLSPPLNANRRGDRIRFEGNVIDRAADGGTDVLLPR